MGTNKELFIIRLKSSKLQKLELPLKLCDSMDFIIQLYFHLHLSDV